MKKLLFITPHLSTGGLPQYLLKKIETFNNQYEIWCIEWSNLSDHFVVQKNKITKILGTKLITLGENKSESLNIIAQINPDIIHLEEIPETFIDSTILDIIYKDDRNYNIVVTTHSSQTNPMDIIYTADKYILVSEWSKGVFTNHYKDEIPCDIWEYPIEKIEVDKTEAKSKLGFDPNYKHVLNVGLFTPGKNQGELIELAKQLINYPIKFHFVGNQAINFKHYWEPLMKGLPKNCVIHGEKSNVDDYLAAADVFYFTSNFELNPLVVKESLSYGLPTFIKKLATYQNTYDRLVTYITNDYEINKKNLLKSLFPEGIEEVKEIEGWFSYSKVYDYFVENATDGMKIVEIGTWFGKSTKYLLDKIKSSGKKLTVEVIDTFKGTSNEQVHTNIVKNYDNDIYQNFYDNIELNEDIIIHKNYSSDSSELFETNSINFLMIDGDHSYEAVTSDIKNYFYKVKQGGIIAGDDYNVFDGTTKAVNDYFLGAHTLFGNNWNWFYRIPKVQIIHLSTLPTRDRAKKSIKNFQLLEKYGFNLKLIQNEVYSGDINIKNYADPTNPNVRPTHYGCFLAHTQALSEIDTENYDFTLILEEDAFIWSSVKEFVDILFKAIFTCQNDDNIAYVSLGSDIWGERTEHNQFFDRCWNQILAHCYLIPNKQKDWYLNKINTTKWDALDLWYNTIFSKEEKKRLVSKTVYSKQLNGISVIDNQYKDYQNGNYGPTPNKSRFDWGNTSEWYKTTIQKEIFEEKIYERFFEVNTGDVVLDFGASIGPFTKSILQKKPSKVICLEPSNDVFKLLQKNINEDNVILLNYGVSNQNTLNEKNSNLFSFDTNKQTEMKTITFGKLLSDYNIKKIDFLKTDCEGGEYDIFTEENFDWIIKNVKKIVGEWHLNTNFDPESKHKFRKFRDTYLTHFTNYEVYSADGIDIKWDLFNDHFISYYQEVLIYIDNR